MKKRQEMACTTIVSRFRVESEYNRLQKTLRQIGQSQSMLTFYEMLAHLQEQILLLTSEVRTKDAKYGRHFPFTMLVNVLSFLDRENSKIARCVCKLWFQALQTNLASKLLFRYPSLIAVDEWETGDALAVACSKETIFVYTSSLDIKAFSPEGKEMRQWKLTEDEHEVNNAAMTFDDEGYLYINDDGDVKVFNVEGNLQRHFPIPAECTGLAICNRRLYTIFKNHNIRVYSLSGEMLNEWSEKKSESGQLLFASDLWVTEKHEIYVADARNRQIHVFSEEGELIRAWGVVDVNNDLDGPLFMRKIVTGGLYDLVYICDPHYSVIKVFTKDGKYVHSWADEDFNPKDLAILNNFVYVINTKRNGSIQKFEHWF